MLNIYVAGKISKNSVFGTHDWRDGFCKQLEELSGTEIKNLDPTKLGGNQKDVPEIFGGDCYLISQCDAVIVYLSDDISIGGSQEILIAKYFTKPVIGLAPHGGKFNGANKEYFGKVVKDYKDPFVFTTCDVVCKNIEEVAKTLQDLASIQPKTLEVINTSIEYYLAKAK